MRILYVFPHPDDESFGPAPAMHRQRRDGHEVFLLTLTRGGATKQRHKYGYSVEQMGEVRYREMQCVAEVLNLSDLTVLDLPDSGLKDIDPRLIEQVVMEHSRRVRPDVLVTYGVHGVSGFADHLVTHAVVKRAFVEPREEHSRPRRLALFTITEEEAQRSTHFPLKGTPDDQLGCVVEVDEDDIAAANRALDCYETFQETIEKSGIRGHLGHRVVFELFGERHAPPLSDLFDRLS